jgi:hypothetical protein
MVVEAILASMLVSKARGGKFSRLSNNPIQSWVLFVVAILLQGLIVFFKANNFEFIDQVGNLLFVISYILLLWGLVLNIKSWPMVVILIGVLLNLAVVGANDFTMPISTQSLRDIGRTEEAQRVEENQVIAYSSFGQATKLQQLSKKIQISLPHPFGKVVSVGDIVVSLGLFLYLQHYMTYVPKRRDSMLKIRAMGSIRR